MLRLTLRSGRDGRLLARIVDRDGVAFVLDYGDPEVVADASRRVLRGGFSVHWQGRIERVMPGAPGLLRLLAIHYATQGVLVFVDEPTYQRRGAIPPEDAPRPLSAGPPTLLPDDPTEGGEDTEILSKRDLHKVLERADAHRARERAQNAPTTPNLETLPLREIPPSDDETEAVDDDDTMEIGRRRK